MDPSTSIGLGVGAAAIIAILISQIGKPALESVVNTASRWHDPLVYLLAFVGGVVYQVGATRGVGWVHVQDALEPGILIGMGAVGTYHLIPKRAGTDPAVQALLDESAQRQQVLLDQVSLLQAQHNALTHTVLQAVAGSTLPTTAPSLAEPTAIGAAA